MTHQPPEQRPFIRPTTPDDLTALIALDHIAAVSAERRAFMERALTERRAWVILWDGHICGYGVLSHDFFGHSFLEMVYIAAEWRSQGLGPLLIRFLETQSRTAVFFTSTNESNGHMQRVLTKLGYERSGIIYNLDPGDPELIYARHLAAASAGEEASGGNV
jgi:ribosomal protein S18 acetylase RimI-like enzyme